MIYLKIEKSMKQKCPGYHLDIVNLIYCEFVPVDQ